MGRGGRYELGTRATSIESNSYPIPFVGFPIPCSALATRLEMSEREQVQAEIVELKARSDSAEAAGLMDLVIVYRKELTVLREKELFLMMCCAGEPLSTSPPP